MTPEEIVARASKAKRIIEDPLVSEALSLMENEIVEAFAACPIRDDEGRRVIQMNLQMVRKFKGFFLGVMESGQVAVHDIREKQSMKDRVINKVRSIT